MSGNKIKGNTIMVKVSLYEVWCILFYSMSS